MATYKVTVTTGDLPFAGTWDVVSVTLLGSEGQSKRIELSSIGFEFSRGKVKTYTIKNVCSLGTLLLLRVEKHPCFIFPEDKWYCSKIEVTTPEDKTILFPCYRWISRGEPVELRGGRATLFFEDDHQLLTDQRKNELQLRKTVYQWKFNFDGLPHGYDNESKPHAEDHFTESRSTNSFEETLKGMFKSKEKWKSFEAMKCLFGVKKTAMIDYVLENWKEDRFFGYQFLNGVNPNVIKRCSKLPSNFPVTNWMVKPFLARGSFLQTELEIGNMFICDYNILEGIATRVVNEQAMYVASGFCLFYINCDKELVPIAIQLAQNPSNDNPIFLPTDSESDWLLAKMFIKNADYLLHQGVQHLLKTHMLGEVFAMATYRNLPSAHPVYKMLIPHFQRTIHINKNIYDHVFGPAGSLSISSLGAEGIQELMKRGFSELKYSALCLPDNITARGLDTIPNFYYRDDGLKLWGVLNSFVKGMTRYYYLSDGDVAKDPELQEWVKDIFMHGVIGNSFSGFPETLETTDELIKFVTMIIFTVSAQHAAVSNGQFDYHSWIPNCSPLLVQPPPIIKDKSSMDSVVEVLPTVGDTAIFAHAAFSLSYKYNNMVPLGSNPDEQFDEAESRQAQKDLQNDLLFLSEAIRERNSKLQVPYNYLNPPYVENSITI
ncbi:polyunsaturated fatty acid lipoxygenase ALOX8-like [Periophthalmus magnuspinnatus]|uniref:polyunsaturated fatty acid lipoxygenase ALOX8-like n=1 Tax=Periophthalmus magnuspinnatus TaxID=409849 RepID=UPI00145A60A6|nr:polyunsaturated fatty acid lipoxygenase ALOX8-like [Periophthalmus magnuspinnatus]